MKRQGKQQALGKLSCYGNLPPFAKPSFILRYQCYVMPGRLRIWNTLGNRQVTWSLTAQKSTDATAPGHSASRKVLNRTEEDSRTVIFQKDISTQKSWEKAPKSLSGLASVRKFSGFLRLKRDVRLPIGPVEMEDTTNSREYVLCQRSPINGARELEFQRDLSSEL